MRKKLLLTLCLILSSVLLLAACLPADEPEVDPVPMPEVPPLPDAPQPLPPVDPIGDGDTFVVDFSDGNINFLLLDFTVRGIDIGATFEVATVDGASALRLVAPSGEDFRLGINVDGLLGARVTDVRTIVFEVYAEFPGGRFAAQTGEITAFLGSLDDSVTQPWTVYLDTRNPNNGIFTFADDISFVAGGPNLLEFARTADRAAEPAIIYIKTITFFDSDNIAIPVNTNAGWGGPQGYGVAPETVGEAQFMIPRAVGVTGGWFDLLTPGTDEVSEEDADFPWEVLAASTGIVFEMDDPDGGMELVYFGAFNNWGWTQVNVSEFWENGVLTVWWDDIGFDPRLVTEEDSAAKISIGNWNDVNITSVFLMVPGGGGQFPFAVPNAVGIVGGWHELLTPGTDEVSEEDADFPWEVLAASAGMVIEMDDPDGGIELVFFGEFNGWSWTQNNVSEFWEAGVLTLYWEDIDFDPSLINEDESQAKIGIGNWNDVNITAVYLFG